MKFILNWVKLHKITAGIILVVLLFIGYRLYPKVPVSPYETATASSSALVQEVSVTGKVQSEESIDLAFEKGGKIVDVRASVGQKVARGDVLLRLDGSDVSASLAQAEASVAFEEATLEKLTKGARAEEIQVSQVTLENAQGSLVDSENGLRESITDAYTKTDDAVRNKTDVLFTNPRTDPQLTIPVSDFRLSLEVISLRKSIESDLLQWNKIISEMKGSDISPSVVSAKKYLGNAKNLLEDLALIVNSVLPSSNVSQATIDTWKSSVSASRGNVNAALASLVASEEKWRGAKSSVALAVDQLALKKAGATPEELSAQKAKLASARASIASYLSQLSKLSLVAPFSGIVTKQDGKRGAIVAPNISLVSVQSVGVFKIEANVPEVDIAKIVTNNTANITLDAYGDDVIFTGIVSEVDPAEKIIDGIPTYKVTLRFDDKEGKVRSGMTANVRIETNKKDGVIAIPSRAVVEKNGKKIVRVLPTSQTPEEREVTVGLRSSDGRVEILSGLAAGEVVITFEKTVK